MLASFLATLVVAGGAAADFEARDFEFAPAEVRVAPGATVRWTNTGQTVHSVTAFDGLFQSEAQPGGSATFSVPADGVHPFVCAYHDWMKGNLTVDPALSRSSPAPAHRTAAPEAGLFLATAAVALARHRRRAPRSSVTAV